MGRPGREAYRAIYLSSPTKFYTALHAFTRATRKFHIDPWKKDPCAYHRHKWYAAKSRERGKWFYYHGPLGGVKLEGWPEPLLLGAAGLIQTVSRAQAERLEDVTFWLQVAERAVALRDVLPVGDLALILDALVTANFRHTLLMQTFTREIIDDVDKLSVVEAAVIANAYAHFGCVSVPLLLALCDHLTALLGGAGPGGDALANADPRSLAVFTKALATLEYRHDAVLTAINNAAVVHVDDSPFPVIAEILEHFAQLRVSFEAPSDFWEAAAAKVPGSRMSALCPALLALGRLTIYAPLMRKAIVDEILKGLKEVPEGAMQEAPVRWGSALRGVARRKSEADDGATTSSRYTVPAFGLPYFPSGMLPAAFGVSIQAPQSQADTGSQFQVPEASDGLVTIEEFPAESSSQEQRLGDSPVDSPGTATLALGKMRWYNGVSRKPSKSARPEYAPFDASANFNRNQRGVRVAQALEGLSLLWRDDTGVLLLPAPEVAATPVNTNTKSENVMSPEVDLVLSAIPVLQGAVQGLRSNSLVATAELYAACSQDPQCADTGGKEARRMVRILLQESVRKLATFDAAAIRRLYNANLSIGWLDPYLQRAKDRRFPQALQVELQNETRLQHAAES